MMQVVFWLFLFFCTVSLDNFFTEQCVAVECVLSYPLGKSAPEAVALPHPGIDALVMTLDDEVLQSDAGMHVPLDDAFQHFNTFFSFFVRFFVFLHKRTYIMYIPHTL